MRKSVRFVQIVKFASVYLLYIARGKNRLIADYSFTESEVFTGSLNPRPCCIKLTLNLVYTHFISNFISVLNFTFLYFLHC